MMKTATRSTTARKRSLPSSAPVARKAAPAARSTSVGGIKSYKAALAFLDSAVNHERMLRPQYNETKFNLSRMARFLSLLGNPQHDLACLHVAGTKGKGSTCHMLASMLQKAGHCTGLYTSPHFIDIRERVVLDGEMISESAFTKIVDRLAAAAAKMPNEQPTHFEFLTALAFVYFAEAGTKYCVLETGMGGRLDATNIIKPLVCGITNISYDHMAQLGHKLEQIAEEKAGIFKAGVPAISAPQPPAVKKVLKRVAAKAGNDLKFIGNELEFSFRFESSRATGPHTRICMATPTSRFDHLQVPLLGEHQAYNCGVALGMIDAMRAAGHPITEQNAIDGLAKVQVQGRLETIRLVPRTIVDAAHNAASVRALMKAIGQNIGYDSMVVIFGCAGDKDIEGMIAQLQTGADKVIFTGIPSPRSADPKDLLARFVEKSGKMAQMAPTLEQAYAIAQRCVTREDIICITGSVYLVGQAKKLAAEGKLV